ncbi:MAG TPA: coenzyme F420-0:L-glutamate ligase [Candidatus Acidoferrum sp.]|jgi:coenzyme F420-0:L-glutamate ligase|nr:coenzyme F420-0:L-glutamate ligase [Candidatus Acidoferrum sp.]
MRLFAVKTRVINIGDDLVEICLESLEAQSLRLEDNDVLAVASKAVSYAEGRLARLSEVKPSKKAEAMAKKHSLRPEFAELILREANRIYGGVEKAVLTLKDGVLAPNAGIDRKNAPDDCVVLWPVDPRKWAVSFREEIRRRTDKRIAVLVVDSGLVPLRIGTSGLALAVAGFKPIRDFRKARDLYGKPILITRLAVADDLASAAHLLMGEATEQAPMVLIKDAPVDFDDGAYDHRDMMMEPKECIFMGTFSHGLRDSK